MHSLCESYRLHTDTNARSLQKSVILLCGSVLQLCVVAPCSRWVRPSIPSQLLLILQPSKWIKINERAVCVLIGFCPCGLSRRSQEDLEQQRDFDTDHNKEQCITRQEVTPLSAGSPQYSFFAVGSTIATRVKN